MANAVDAILIRQYSDNIQLLSQQLLPILKPTVFIKPGCTGEMAFQDQLASTEAEEKIGRNQDVVNDDPLYNRRKIVPRYFYKAPLVDSMDKVFMAKDPTSEIVQNNGGALARAQDTVIAEALFGTAYNGKDGTVSNDLTAANKVAIDGTNGLTVSKLRAAVQILNEYSVPQGDRFCAHSAAQLTNMLAATEVTSSDFNTVKALVDGQMGATFLGLKFVMTEKMPITTTTRKVGVYHRSGLVLGIWLDMKASIDILPGKHFSAQIYAGQSYGATRLEEEKVVEISCYEA
jgi:hypothetical protein